MLASSCEAPTNNKTGVGAHSGKSMTVIHIRWRKNPPVSIEASYCIANIQMWDSGSVCVCIRGSVCWDISGERVGKTE